MNVMHGVAVVAFSALLMGGCIGSSGSAVSSVRVSPSFGGDGGSEAPGSQDHSIGGGLSGGAEVASTSAGAGVASASAASSGSSASASFSGVGGVTASSSDGSAATASAAVGDEVSVSI